MKWSLLVPLVLLLCLGVFYVARKLPSKADMDQLESGSAMSQPEGIVILLESTHRRDLIPKGDVMWLTIDASGNVHDTKYHLVTDEIMLNILTSREYNIAYLAFRLPDKDSTSVNTLTRALERVQPICDATGRGKILLLLGRGGKKSRN